MAVQFRQPSVLPLVDMGRVLRRPSPFSKHMFIFIPLKKDWNLFPVLFSFALTARPRLQGALFHYNIVPRTLSRRKLKKIKKLFFPKTLDKHFDVCYTIDTIKKERGK